MLKLTSIYGIDELRMTLVDWLSATLRKRNFLFFFIINPPKYSLKLTVLLSSILKTAQFLEKVQNTILNNKNKTFVGLRIWFHNFYCFFFIIRHKFFRTCISMFILSLWSANLIIWAKQVVLSDWIS
jgi:hypothetical protein